MKEAVTHIERPNLPWRHDRLTECRLPTASYPTWTREEAADQLRDLGKTRFAMLVCITCWQTGERYATWEESPLGCMARHVAPTFGRRDDAERMDAELRAIAALIEKHKGEFVGFLQEFGAATAPAPKRKPRRRAKPEAQRSRAIPIAELAEQRKVGHGDAERMTKAVPAEEMDFRG